MCGGLQIGIMKKKQKIGAAAFLAHFWPVLGPCRGLGLRLGQGVWLGLRPYLDPTAVSYS